MTHHQFRPIFLLFLCAVLVGAVSEPVRSQAIRAVVVGTVVDTTDASLPSVEISITNEATGISRSLVTNEVGAFRLDHIAPGQYRLEAQLPGFKTHVVTFDLNIGQVKRLPITLEIGDITESIEVLAETGLAEVQTDTNELSTVISEEYMDRIPTEHRKVSEIFKIAPGVAWFSISVRDGHKPWFSVAGSGGSSHIWRLDGGTVKQARGRSGSPTNLTPPPDVMKQVRVVSNSYSAEYGLGDGALLIMESKTGTNEIHGTLYYFGRNDKVDARPFFSVGKPPLRHHQYGGVIGGPLKKDKTHYFVSVEKQKTVEFLEWLVNVPSLLEKQGDFSQSLNSDGSLRTIYDPATLGGTADAPTREPFPGNVIPVDRFDSVAKQMMDMYPDPNLPGTITGAENFTANPPDISLTRTWHFYRVDHTFSDSDNMYWRTALDLSDNVLEGPFGLQIDEKSQTNVADGNGHTGVWNHTFTPTLTNQARFSVSIFRSPRRQLFWDFGWAQRLGLKNLSTNTMPKFYVQEYRNIGQGWYATEPTIKGLRGTMIEDSLVYLRGKHTFKFGAEYQHSRFVLASRFWPSGRSDYDRRSTQNPASPGGTGKGGASFLLGEVVAGLVEAGPRIDDRAFWVGMFFQDDWRATQDLTLSLGIRYEYDQPVIDVTESHSSFDRQALNPVCNCPGVVLFGQQLFDASGHHTPRFSRRFFGFNLMPRTGLAWTPGGRQDLVLRAGFGVFYIDPSHGDGFWGTPRLGTNQRGDFTTIDNGLTPAFKLEEGFPAVPLETRNASFGAVPVPVGGFTPEDEQPRLSVGFFEPNRPMSYRMLFNMGMQKRFGETVVEVGYLGNVARRLGGAYNISELRPENYGPGNRQHLRAFPQFNGVRANGVHAFATKYHAGFVLLRGKLFSRDLAYQTNYTFSRHLADSTIRGIFHIQDYWGPSSQEVRHRFVWSSVWELPWGPGKRHLSSGPAASILGGWVVSGFLNWQSRGAGTIQSSTNTLNNFGANQGVDRIDLGVRKDTSNFDPGQPCTPGGSQTGCWFNVDSFAFTEPFTYGDSGTRIIPSPVWTQLDMSLFKNFQIWEDISTEFRVDFFNALNHTNFNGPNTTFGGGSFGRITTSGRGRIIEYSLRFSW